MLTRSAAADAEPDDDMITSQATSAEERSGSGQGAGPSAGDARPPGPTPPPSAAGHPPAPRSVRFARGPLPDRPDGHPLHTEARPGPPPRGAAASRRAARLGREPFAEHEEEPLTPAHLRLLAVELGPENGPSIMRLKRR